MLIIILQIGTRLFCSSSLDLVTLISMGEIHDGCTMIKVHCVSNWLISAWSYRQESEVCHTHYFTSITYIDPLFMHLCSEALEHLVMNPPSLPLPTLTLVSMFRTWGILLIWGNCSICFKSLIRLKRVWGIRMQVFEVNLTWIVFCRLKWNGNWLSIVKLDKFNGC